MKKNQPKEADDCPLLKEKI